MTVAGRSVVSPADAAEFGWGVAVPLVQFLLFVAVLLLGFALLKEI